MVDSESLSRRLLILNEAASELRQHPRAEDPDALRTDPLLRAAVERWLRVCVEACVDMAYRVIAQQGWTPPTSAKDAFTTLASHQIISLDLAKRLGVEMHGRQVVWRRQG